MCKKNFTIIFILSLIINKIENTDIPNDICRGKDEEFLPHPDEGRCTEFIICVFENPFVLNCVRQNEIFHPPSRDCVAGDPETCVVFSHTSSAVTTTKTELTTLQSGISTEMSTEPEISNEPETTADPEISTETESSTEPEATTLSTTSTLPTSPPELCDGNNLRLVPNPDYCFKFYFCVFGVAISFECIPNTIFDEELQYCIDGDWDTCEPYTTTTDKTTTEQETSTKLETTTESEITTDPGPPELCDGNNFRLVPNPYYCFRFYFCVFGVASPYECLPNTIFDEELQYCIDGNWDTCEFHTTTNEPITVTDEPTTDTTQYHTTDTESEETTESEITTEPKTTTSTNIPTTTTLPTGPPELCEGNNLRLVPNPYYCFKFYFCAFGTAIPFECLPNRIFSEKSQYCIDGDWDTCEPYTTTTDKTTTEQETSTELVTTDLPIHQCPPDGVLLIPDHSNCRRYFSCHSGERHLHFCPIGLYFDSVQLRCTLRRFAVCAGDN